MKKDLEYYVNLPWIAQIEYVTDDGSPYYMARDLMLGCRGDGFTPGDATKDLWNARRDLLTAMLEYGDEVPEPYAKAKVVPSVCTQIKG